MRAVTELGSDNHEADDKNVDGTIFNEDDEAVKDGDSDRNRLAVSYSDDMVVVYDNLKAVSAQNDTYVNMGNLREYIDKKKSQPDAFKDEHAVTYFSLY